MHMERAHSVHRSSTEAHKVSTLLYYKAVGTVCATTFPCTAECYGNILP